MINISSQQLDQFQQQMDVRYYDDLGRLLREQCPKLVAHLDVSALRDQIAAAVAKARSLGVVSGEAIVAFVGLWIFSGPTFTEQPKMRQFLEGSKGNPDDKVHWLFNRALQKIENVLPPPKTTPTVKS